MKMNTSFPRWVLFASLIVAFVLALVAWKGGPQQHRITNAAAQDTIPDKKSNKAGDRDLDKELQHLETAREQLERMQEKDWNKIQREVEGSIRKIDIETIRQQATEALEKLHPDKLRIMEESLSRIDFDKIQQQIDESMATIDKEETRAQLKKARQQLQEVLEKQEWKENLEKAQHIQKEVLDKQMQQMGKDMEKLQERLKNQEFNFKKEMDKAAVELHNAREELKGYQLMIYDMEKDKLLNTREDYSIEYKNGDLFINGRKQSPEVANRYKKYFRKDKLTIEKKGGDMHIQHQWDKHPD